MRKFLVVILAIGLLVTSCLNAPTTAAAGTKYDATQDARITVIEGIILGQNGLQTLVGALNTKVAGMGTGDSARISAVESKVAVLEGKVSAGTGGVTQASVDALSARIKTLEDWKAGSGSSGGGTLDPTDGAILDADGDLQLILERSVEEEVYLDNNVPQRWRLTVRNNGTSSRYFRIGADFDCEETVNIATGTSFEAEYSGTSVTITPSPVIANPSVVSLPFVISGSSNRIYIGKSRDEDMYVSLNVVYGATPTSRRWTWDFSIREVN